MNDAKKALLIIAPGGFRDEELVHTRQVLQGRNVAVTVASTKTGEFIGMKGRREKVSVSLDEVAGYDYDALVIVGGDGTPESLWDHPGLREMTERHYRLGKIVAGICLGAVVLARAGLLKGTPATVYADRTAIEIYNKCGALYRNQPVIRNGNIITANGPSSAREFGMTIGRALGVC